MNTSINKRGPARPTIMSAADVSTLTDRELVVLSQEGCSAALNALLKRHKKTVSRILGQLAPDWRDRADDMAQEIYIRMWKNIGLLRNPQALNSWIRQITTNLFYDELRKRPRTLLTISMDESTNNEGEPTAARDIADPKPTPEQIADRRELASTVHTAISQLPERYRTAVVLREVHDMTYEEIAIHTGSELGTVKSRICRGRAIVQTAIALYMQAA
jgi:RNA polymerase sigma-70 factor, ECF subfamily